MGEKKLLGKWEGPHVIMVVGRNNRGRKGKPVVMTERMDVSRLMDSKVADVTEDQGFLYKQGCREEKGENRGAGGGGRVSGVLVGVSGTVLRVLGEQCQRCYEEKRQQCYGDKRQQCYGEWSQQQQQKQNMGGLRSCKTTGTASSVYSSITNSLAAPHSLVPGSNGSQFYCR